MEEIMKTVMSDKLMQDAVMQELDWDPERLRLLLVSLRRMVRLR